MPLAAAATTPPTKPGSKTDLFESEILAYPSQKNSFSSITTDLQIPECQTDQSLKNCVATICDQVAVELLPLNKHKVGEATIRPKDDKKLEKMIIKAEENSRKAATALQKRIVDGNLNMDTPEGRRLSEYLIHREQLIERSLVRNCGGGTAKVLALLSEQPVIKQQQASFEVYGTTWRRGGEGEHTVARIKGKSSKRLTCDPWNLEKWYERAAEPVGVCTDKQIRDGKILKCANLNDQLWAKDEEASYKIITPDISKCSRKEQLFYHQEVQRQNARFIELNKKHPKRKLRKKRNQRENTSLKLQILPVLEYDKEQYYLDSWQQ